LYKFRLRILNFIIGAIFGWPFFIFPTSTFGEELSSLAQSKHWLRLLHFQTSLFGKQESQVDSPIFFLSGNKQDAEAELRSTLKALYLPQDPQKLDEHAQCRFPARTAWLIKNLRISDLPLVRCPAFTGYFERIKAKSIVLIFSSYNTGGPSSLFGHTFVRINQRKSDDDGPNFDLTNMGFNFAANQDTDNPILYTIKGIFGGFKGVFSLVPFYYKVREYSDFESRDLWEYEFKFTEEESKFFVKHLWELGDAWFDYTYFFENCSWHMLTALEAIRPDLNFTEHLQFATIPSDTVRVLFHHPEMLKEVKFRPSAQRRFLTRYYELSKPEATSTLEMVKHLSTDSLPDQNSSRGRVLDAAIDYMDFEYAANLAPEISNEFTKFKHVLLRERSKIGNYNSTIIIPVPENEAPHLAHSSNRWQVGNIWREHRPSDVSLGYRFALHDLIDPPLGFPEGIGLAMFNFDFTANIKTHSFRLTEFSFFDLKSFKSVLGFEQALSWEAKLGMWRTSDQNCFDCLATAGESSVGVNVSLSSLMPALFFLAASEVTYSPEYIGRELNLNLGPKIGASIFLPLGIRSHHFWQRKFFVEQNVDFEDFFKSEVQKDLNKKLSIRFKYSASLLEKNYSVVLLFYPN